jgi:hypothetical protein
MIIEIPIKSGAASQNQLTTLAGRRYRIAFDWNQRIGRWFIGLETESGDVLLSGKALSVNTDLLRQIRHIPECPEGMLMLLDPTGADREADLYSVGVDHVLAFGSEG